MSKTLESIQAQQKQFIAGINGAATKENSAFRAKAIEAFSNQSIPTRKDEEYKFTDIGKFINSNFDLDIANQKNIEIMSSQIEEHTILKTGVIRIVLVNGILNEEFSELDQLEPGISINKLNDAIFSGKIESIEGADPFTNLNNSFLQHGLSIEIEKNAIIEKPILIQNYNTDAALSFVNPKLLVAAAQGAQATLIEKVITLGEAGFTNHVAEFDIAENANISHYKIQNDHSTTLEIGNTIVNQARNSVFSNYVFTLGGGMVRNNLTININDEGCEANMYGLYLVGAKTHIDNHTVVDHKAPHSFSNEFYKGILADQSKGVFNGKIFVREGAQKTNAFQSNNNILLSDDAVINTKPQLEIWADDVKCSHGCTTGQLDEEALFYLRARGIERKKAMDLLLDAFASEVVEKVNFDPIKAYISDFLHQRFSN